MHLKNFIVLLITFKCALASAQSAAEVFENYVNKFQSRDNFKVNIAYKTYKGDSKVPFQIVKGEKRYTTLGYLEKTALSSNIIGKDFSIQINKENKSIYYTNEVVNPKGTHNFSLSLLTNYFEVLPLDVVSNNTLYKIVFQLRLHISDYPYSRIEFFIDKKTAELRKQVFYSTAVTNFSTNPNETDLGVQRLEIEYHHYTDFDNIAQPEIYKKENYIKLSDKNVTNQAVSLQPDFSSYQLYVAGTNQKAY